MRCRVASNAGSVVLTSKPGNQPFGIFEDRLDHGIGEDGAADPYSDHADPYHVRDDVDLINYPPQGGEVCQVRHKSAEIPKWPPTR